VTENNIIRLQKWQVKTACDVLSRAFINDAFLNYLEANEKKRAHIQEHYTTFELNYGILYGEAYTTSLNMEGIAVWIHSDNLKDTLWRFIRSGGLNLVFNINPIVLNKMKRADDYFQAFYRRHAPFPHWYLALLGVDTQFQGKGYAGKLLEPMFARIDKENLPCYLETEPEGNVSFYQHYGFEVIDEVVIPKTNVKLWLMLRKRND